MTMLPMKRKCEVCGKWYSFNPSIGKINCPHCGALCGTVENKKGLIDKKK